jgi:hypothetical protein
MALHGQTISNMLPFYERDLDYVGINLYGLVEILVRILELRIAQDPLLWNGQSLLRNRSRDSRALSAHSPELSSSFREASSASAQQCSA